MLILHQDGVAIELSDGKFHRASELSGDEGWEGIATNVSFSLQCLLLATIRDETLGYLLLCQVYARLCKTCSTCIFKFRDHQTKLPQIRAWNPTGL